MMIGVTLYHHKKTKLALFTDGQFFCITKALLGSRAHFWA